MERAARIENKTQMKRLLPGFVVALLAVGIAGYVFWSMECPGLRSVDDGYQAGFVAAIRTGGKFEEDYRLTAF
jgi:hypothetical protein